MIFGEGLAAAPSAEPAAWVADALDLGRFTVGGLVPNHHDAVVAIEAADPASEDWWAAQQAIVTALAEVLVGFTSTPERCWFAIWEGHGYDRTEEIRRELAALPKLHLPTRTYHLLTGRTLDVAALRWPPQPGWPEQWFRPDLWWPDDRRWFVATDVDLWSTYVAGPADLTAAVRAHLGPRCRPVTLDDAVSD